MKNTHTSSHTPGPWTIQQTFERADEIVPFETDVSSPDFGTATTYGRTREESEANAALVAAAPTLLAALREMVIANHGLPANPADEADPVCRAALEGALAALASVS